MPGLQYQVILVKEFCDIDGNWSTHKRNMTLPMAPHKGLGVIVNRSDDPRIIECVFVSSDGSIVVTIERDNWEGEKEEFGESKGDWDSQLKYQLEGWEKISGGPCGIIRLY